MSERAFKNHDSDHDVVRLDDDERWQQRLAEARVRRAIALQEKANGDTNPTRRAKPWEEEAQPSLPTIVEAPRERDENGEVRKDFADRVAAIRATRDADTGAQEPDTPDAVRRPKPAPKEPSATTRPVLIARKSQAGIPNDLDPSVFALRRPSAPAADKTLAYGASLTALPELVAQTDVEPEAEAATPRRGRPRGLAIGLFALALLPFLNVLPPRETGPDAPATPFFGLQPAFGLTAPNFAPPVATRAGEWTPRTNAAPAAPLSVQNSVAPTLWPGMDTLPTVNPGEGLDLSIPAQTALVRTPDAVQLASAGVDGMPARPLQVSEVAVQTVTPSLGSYAGDSGVVGPVAPLDGPILKFAGAVPVLSADAILASAEARPTVSTSAAPPATAVAEPLRVTVLVPEQADRSLAADVADAITDMGHDVLDVKVVNLTISERNVRYYHAQDRDAAQGVAQLNGARLRDFTSFRPSPSEGVIEVWLSGKAADRPVYVAKARSSAPSVTTAPVRATKVVEERRGVLGWLSDKLGGHDNVNTVRHSDSDGDNGSDLRTTRGHGTKSTRSTRAPARTATSATSVAGSVASAATPTSGATAGHTDTTSSSDAGGHTGGSTDAGHFDGVSDSITSVSDDSGSERDSDRSGRRDRDRSDGKRSRSDKKDRRDRDDD